MNKCLFPYFFACLLFLRGVSTLTGSDIRLKSMGFTNIALPDNDNQINLVDFGKNAAWLLRDQQNNWTQLEGAGHYQHGSFHRLYDPGKTVGLSGRFIVLQHFGENSVFYGSIEHNYLNYHNVYSSSDRDAYAEHPFRVTDLTTGRINRYGPKLRMTYNSAFLKQQLLWAGTISYQVESGLKKALIRPENVCRNIGLGMAVAFIIHPRISLGVTLDYTNSQENNDYAPPESFLSSHHEISLFVSERYSIPLGENMDIIKRGQQFHFGVQSVFKLSSGAIGLNFQYFSEDVNVQKEIGHSQQGTGTWYQQGYVIELISRQRIGQTPFFGGLAIKYRSADNFSRHWKYPIKLAENSIRTSFFGSGLAYSSPQSKIKVALQYCYEINRFNRNDTNSKLFADGLKIDKGIHIGLEYAFSDFYFLRTGFRYYRNTIDSDLLIFSEYKNAHWRSAYTFGFGVVRKNMILEYHFQYDFDKERITVNPDDREGYKIECVIKFLK